MKTGNTALNDSKIFLIFAILAVFLMWALSLLAIAGLFDKIIVFSLFIIFLGTVVFLTKKNLQNFSGEFKAILILILSITVSYSFFVTPTIFSGRDYGAISEAAIRLSQFQSLTFDAPEARIFFDYYGPGKALNFPGFYYTDSGSLTTQFPVPYTAWLAAFYSLFGLTGFVLANAILFFFFVFSFFLILRHFTTFTVGICGTLLAATSFPLFWFFKFTLTENMALALAWVGLLSLLVFVNNITPKNYFFTLSIFSILALTRIEGSVILIFLLVFLVSKNEIRNFLFAKKQTHLLLPFLVFLIIFCVCFFVNMPFFRETAKGLLDYSANEKISLRNLVVENNIYLLRVFYLYNLIQYLLLGLAGIIILLKKRRHQELFVFFVLAPVFLYLVNSKISPDHPWLLRRYVFAVIPALVFYSCLLIYNFFWITRKRTAISIFAILFILNLLIFQKYAFFSDNKNLLPEIETISETFSANDLVLVDRVASGDGWSMISGPLNFLYGKKAVYFFNPHDLQRIKTGDFNKVYLMVADENVESYSNVIGSRMEFLKNYQINTQQMKSTEDPGHLPEKTNVKTTGKIYIINP